MLLWRIVSFPFTLLYSVVVFLRNWLYDHGYSRITCFEANVIGVGNLAIGGTGKTPMIDYLIRNYLSRGYGVSTLSRGYGRQTSGFRLAREIDTVDTLGDEPYMYWRTHGQQVNVAVSEDRELAIPQLLGFADPEVVLMDDAFQHRRVQSLANILLTTFDHPFYDDFLLPAGRLREHRIGAGRADIIIVTKCPMVLSESEQVQIKERIRPYSSASVYFTSIDYLDPVPIFNNGLPLKKRVVAISGVANSVLFEKEVRLNYQVKLTHSYRDHYRYKPADIKDIIMELDAETSLLVTEKDMVKLEQFRELEKFSCYYLPIRVKFLKDESLFQLQLDSILKNYAQ